MTTQDKIFLKEGDNYYKRNKHITFTEANDSVLEYLAQKSIGVKNVLEIGCSDGARLHHIATTYAATCHGIEPSHEAVEAGSKRFSNITLTRGVSHDLRDFEDETFDVVILNYVFHWVDRKKLLLTISEIDRVLQDNGHIIIKDFYPKTPYKTEYHHLPKGDAYTYKQNYPAIFTASNIYHQVYEKVEQHKTGDKTEEDATRVHMVVLEKSIENAYPIKEMKQ